MLAHCDQHRAIVHGEQADTLPGRSGAVPDLLHDAGADLETSGGVITVVGKDILFREVGEDRADKELVFPLFLHICLRVHHRLHLAVALLLAVDLLVPQSQEIRVVDGQQGQIGIDALRGLARQVQIVRQRVLQLQPDLLF